MAIKTGRYGQVKWDAAGTTPVLLISLNAWTGDFKTEMEDVTCFGDVNRVYIPGMKDAKGTIGGFWNSEELAIIEASDDDVPLFLELTPNINEPLFTFEGLAYVSAELEVPVAGAPTISGTFAGAGPWTLPTGT